MSEVGGLEEEVLERWPKERGLTIATGTPRHEEGDGLRESCNIPCGIGLNK